MTPSLEFSLQIFLKLLHARQDFGDIFVHTILEAPLKCDGYEHSKSQPHASGK